ncbi:hypothetical protein C8R42DRAFT_715094 [Lentinula raphanica]|nr:hypothetical protein C8R42DRAFT_722158 [Lentinula raphanica]KAJ3730390.1 hypothetical protein C8R42DRAFT_715094 [Lentinula raphanica]
MSMRGVASDLGGSGFGLRWRIQAMMMVVENDHDELLSILQAHGQKFLSSFNGGISTSRGKGNVQSSIEEVEEEEDEDEEWQGIQTNSISESDEDFDENDDDFTAASSSTSNANTKNLGNYHPTLKRLLDPDLETAKPKKRVRGLQMGVESFKDGTLRLSRREIDSVQGHKGGTSGRGSGRGGWKKRPRK